MFLKRIIPSLIYLFTRRTVFSQDICIKDFSHLKKFISLQSFGKKRIFKWINYDKFYIRGFSVNIKNYSKSEFLWIINNCPWEVFESIDISLFCVGVSVHVPFLKEGEHFYLFKESWHDKIPVNFPIRHLDTGEIIKYNKNSISKDDLIMFGFVRSF